TDELNEEPEAAISSAAGILDRRAERPDKNHLADDVQPAAMQEQGGEQRGGREASETGTTAMALRRSHWPNRAMPKQRAKRADQERFTLDASYDWAIMTLIEPQTTVNTADASLALMPAAAQSPLFTPNQGQYLAFIYAYTRVLRRPPAEAGLQRH